MVGGVTSELQSYVNNPLVQQALASQPAVGAALNRAGTALGQLGNVGEARLRLPPCMIACMHACTHLVRFNVAAGRQQTALHTC